MENLILGQARASGVNNPFIANDSILNPNSIQKDLDALTSDLKNIKSQKPKKEELVNEEETTEFDDADDFKSWIKENTATDAETGNIFFVQPLTGEKVPIEGNPETNVLLYEVFKEQTGREGEALEAIKTMNIEELQRTPDVQKTVERETNEFDDRFTKDLKKVRKTLSDPTGSKGFFDNFGSLFEKNDEGSFLTVKDKKNDTANNFSLEVNQSSQGAKFQFFFKVENLKLLPGSYDVSISSKNISHFKSKTDNVEYWIALEPESTYEV